MRFISLFIVLAGAWCGPLMARTAEVDVSVPPEVFNSQNERPMNCQQCCIYDNRPYSEGAVIEAAGGVLLQCQRDDKTLSTHFLTWRRVKP
ncbi:hypothetical protein TUM12370_22500 [Salmonella enterica subsp. enterica serovar Choleraesuis]|nr:hypothetical protein TUM12370_22500 [Salmonella enterica subsp. enterica serovar Choleraesuis]